MSQKYYAIVTNLGAAKIANAAALGTKLNITQMAVGDGGGTLPTPNASQTKLVNEKRRAAINTLSIDPANASQVIAEQVIPETEGGFWIREMGLFDADGNLIAVCNTPETYKPALQEGSGRTQTVRMILIVNSTDAVTLKIDPSVVLATRQYVDSQAVEVRQYAGKLMADHVAEDNPHEQYAPLKSPVFTGAPEVPDMDKGNYGQQAANSKFVRDAINVLINGAPENMNTLGEIVQVIVSLTGNPPANLNTLEALAEAVGNSPTFANDVSKSIANLDNGQKDIKDTVSGKMSKSANGSDIADKAAFLSNIGAGTAATKAVGNGAGQIPDMSFFPLNPTQTGWAKLPNGLIIQWGVTPNTVGTIQASFLLPFPSAALWVGKNTYSNGTTATSTSVFEVSGLTRTGFYASNIATLVSSNTAVAGPVNGGIAFFAIGY
ncbi:phage tail protein [Pantoea allii]|uniref:phage tail protein n=1 Tax=Pantoea allii TaxID=574096 RepID=UPI0024B80E7F|nr:phage tail protein [Pantoea allii]MDJ0037347.1 phage tail protein [Pantoea allii]